MPVLIAWSGFLGAWLLVAGPVFQAAVELDEETFDRDSITVAARSVGPQPRVSPWWWLLPPVAFLIQRNRTRAYRQALLEVLDRADIERMVSFGNVATGWLIVGLGAFGIAIKESWELCEVYEWPAWVFALLVAVALTLSFGYTVARMRRAHQMLQEPTAD